MTPNPKISEPSDASERERATSTFNRNLVVTAGAGTGKTTLLVDRLVHLLMRNPESVRITDIVALTFTNKAANEMKLRLRERLQSYLAVRLDRDPGNEREEKFQAEIRSLIDRYQLSKSELDARAHDALRNIERSEIGTIHSFAATLLRLYPMEAGVDPQFREDDGTQFERIFDEQWALWLDHELSLQGPRKDDWKNILRRFPLEQVKELAVSLCSETVELDRLAATSRQETAPGPIRSWLGGLEAKACSLLERHPEDRLNEKLVRAAQGVIHGFRESGAASEDDLKEEISLLLSGRAINKRLKGWREDEIEEAQETVRVAKGLCQVDRASTDLLSVLLAPFVERLREVFVREGFVSFDGLLVRARNLVRDHAAVREELKQHFKAILIDEFQDTDPIQYEILLYLAEQAGRQAREWRDVKLFPGKIFVVGDPKQSIYAFRRADIEAYLEVVEKIIKAQDGIECLLTTNFRSHAGILDVVNGVFESLIHRRDGLQPPYIAIHPAANDDESGAIQQGKSHFRKVTVQKIVSGDGATDAETARRLEAESLARWLREEILEKAEITSREGVRVRAQPKDVAILFRKLTDIQAYLEPLRRREIRYIVEGERHFYAVKEIIDAVNVLRAVENPHDKLALVGVLRSPLGGLMDNVIYRLHQEGLLDYRTVKRLKEKNHPSTVGELYEALDRLRQQTRILSVGEAVAHIFDSLPLKLLAACSFHGEQAVANLEKLRQQAELLGREGSSTLKEVIHQLQRRVLDLKEEGESALAEENLDAVRIMSIHKAKGLEFPIVVVAGCHAGTDPRQGARAEALSDWSTGLAGLRVGQTWDLRGLYIAEKTRMRAEEEQKRVLYVAMTRAREHLVLSCAPGGRQPSGSFLTMLDQALQENITTAEESMNVPVGNGMVEIQVVEESLVAPGKSKVRRKGVEKVADWKPFVEVWNRRSEEYEKINNTPLFLTPTELKRREEELAEGGGKPRSLPPSAPSLLLGELAHRFLQDWDFREEVRSSGDKLRPFLEKWLPPDSKREGEQIQRELENIFDCFFASEAYAEICRSQILGRELPFLIPWDGRIMEGVIDLLYEHEGRLYLADYKTDQIDRRELERAAERYRHQVRIYSEAARRTLRKDVAGFKLLFLRLGEAVEVS